MDVVRGLMEFGCSVDIYDPWADPSEIKREYHMNSIMDISKLTAKKYDAIILAVAHREFAQFDVTKYRRPNAVIFDIKGVLPKELVDGRL